MNAANAPESVVIAGGGLAGATAAFALRKRGFGGRVTVIGDEPLPPYERPPLSKTYLRGEEPIDKALVRPTSDYETEQIELMTGRRAVDVDPAGRRVILDDGSTLSYGALLLATGSEPRRLDVPGGDLDGVRYLRNVGDADAIRSAAMSSAKVVVVGGGWIGSEVAASLRQLGLEVTIVSNVARPLERVLGPEIADVYRAVHTEHGNRIVVGEVTAVEGDERSAALRLADGRAIAADLVVVGIGAIPRLALAERAGLALADGGIEVDEFLATSAPGIYAAGDIAAAWHPRYGRRLRIEHWDNAIRQGRAAAANMLGAAEPYVRTPYFYSDQFDLGMEYRGHAPAWEQVVVRGDLGAREFLAFWLDGGRVVAAMNANVWDAGDELQRLVDAEAEVEPDRLADPDVPLAEAA
jgi:3-phenylpropionate/trans-cinnamate dioxygenase ferredoxin reductase subunit